MIRKLTFAFAALVLAAVPTLAQSPTGSWQVDAYPVDAAGHPAATTVKVPFSNVPIEVLITNYYTSSDGNDYGPALTRAVAALASTGGRIRYPGGKTYPMTPVTILKQTKPIRISGDNCSSVLSNVAGNANPIIVLGNNVAGGTNVSFSYLSFTGTDISASQAVKLQWGNSTEFDHVCWQTLLNGIVANDSYGVSIVNSPLILNIGAYVFYSSTTAHDFHFINNKGFNIGKVAGVEQGGAVRIDGAGTFSVILKDNDLEVFTYLANLNGAYNPAITDNYFEQASDSLIIAAGTVSGATIMNNTISIGAAWTLTGFSGGRFANNSINSTQVVTINNTGAPDMLIGQNVSVAGGTVSAPNDGSGLWTTYSPSVTYTGTAPTTANAPVAAYRQTSPRTYDVKISDYTVVTVGSATGAVVFGMPNSTVLTTDTPCSGVDNGNGAVKFSRASVALTGLALSPGTWGAVKYELMCSGLQVTS